MMPRPTTLQSCAALDVEEPQVHQGRCRGLRSTFFAEDTVPIEERGTPSVSRKRRRTSTAAEPMETFRKSSRHHEVTRCHWRQESRVIQAQTSSRCGSADPQSLDSSRQQPQPQQQRHQKQRRYSCAFQSRSRRASPVCTDHLGVSGIAFALPLQRYIESPLHGRNGLRSQTTAVSADRGRSFRSGVISREHARRLAYRAKQRTDAVAAQSDVDEASSRSTVPDCKSVPGEESNGEGSDAVPERGRNTSIPPGLLTPVGPDWWVEQGLPDAVITQESSLAENHHGTAIGNDPIARRDLRDPVNHRLTSHGSPKYRPTQDLSSIEGRPRPENGARAGESRNEGGENSIIPPREESWVGHENPGQTASNFQDKKQNAPYGASRDCSSPEGLEDMDENWHNILRTDTRLRSRPSSAQPFERRPGFGATTINGRPRRSRRHHVPRGAWDLLTGRKLKPSSSTGSGCSNLPTDRLPWTEYETMDEMGARGLESSHAPRGRAWEAGVTTNPIEYPTQSVRRSVTHFHEEMQRSRLVSGKTPLDGLPNVREPETGVRPFATVQRRIAGPLPPPTPWPEEVGLSPGDLIVTVEHCAACSRHSMSLHHNANTYMQRAEAVKEAVVRALASVGRPVARSIERGKQPGQTQRTTYVLTKPTTERSESGGVGRVGAFEVQVTASLLSKGQANTNPRRGNHHDVVTRVCGGIVRAATVSSKLTSGKWPRPEGVARRVIETLRGWGALRDSDGPPKGALAVKGGDLPSAVSQANTAELTRAAGPVQITGVLGTSDKTVPTDGDDDVTTIERPPSRSGDSVKTGTLVGEEVIRLSGLTRHGKASPDPSRARSTGHGTLAPMPSGTASEAPVLRDDSGGSVDEKDSPEHVGWSVERKGNEEERGRESAQPRPPLKVFSMGVESIVVKGVEFAAAETTADPFFLVRVGKCTGKSTALADVPGGGGGQCSWPAQALVVKGLLEEDVRSSGLEVEVWDALGWIIARGAVTPSDACRALEVAFLSVATSSGGGLISPPSITCALTGDRDRNRGGQATFGISVLEDATTSGSQEHGNVGTSETTGLHPAVDAMGAGGAHQTVTNLVAQQIERETGEAGQEGVAESCLLNSDDGTLNGIGDLLFSAGTGGSEFPTMSSSVASGNASGYSSFDGWIYGVGEDRSGEPTAIGQGGGGTIGPTVSPMKSEPAVIAATARNSEPTSHVSTTCTSPTAVGGDGSRARDTPMAQDSGHSCAEDTPTAGSAAAFPPVTRPLTTLNAEASRVSSPSGGSGGTSSGEYSDDNFDYDGAGAESEEHLDAVSLFAFSDASSFENVDGVDGSADDKEGGWHTGEEATVTAATARLRRRLWKAAEKCGGGDAVVGGPALFAKMDADQDGQLTVEELRKALPATSKKAGLDLSPSQLAALVAGMDLVGKRSANLREFQAFLGATPHPRGGNGEDEFGDSVPQSNTEMAALWLRLRHTVEPERHDYTEPGSSRVRATETLQQGEVHVELSTIGAVLFEAHDSEGSGNVPSGVFREILNGTGVKISPPLTSAEIVALSWRFRYPRGVGRGPALDGDAGRSDGVSLPSVVSYRTFLAWVDPVDVGRVAKRISRFLRAVGGPSARSKYGFSSSPIMSAAAAASDQGGSTCIAPLGRDVEFHATSNSSGTRKPESPQSRSIDFAGIVNRDCGEGGKAVERRAIADIFQVVDADASGNISENELIKAVNGLGLPVTQAEARVLMLEHGGMGAGGELSLADFDNMVRRQTRSTLTGQMP